MSQLVTGNSCRFFVAAFWISLLTLLIPGLVFASGGEAAAHGHAPPLYTVTPFVLMLACIAVLPLVAEHWWHKNKNKFYISLILGVPVGVFLLFFWDGGPHWVWHTAVEYFSFIMILAALYIISGGIYVGGDLRATPMMNAAFLAIGSVLASFMGTTGAAMLLIRPVIKTNAERKYKSHTIIFFTFLVGNIGGLLTPLGDPPLFMGYLKGVPFAWTFKLWLEWAVCVGIVLFVYFIWDNILYAREEIKDIKRDAEEIRPLHILGKWNFGLLACVVCTVAFVPMTPHREIILGLLAVISLLITSKQVRHWNEFNYDPIIEVAVLFFGIFLTMIPAIMLLNLRGSELGVTEPWQFFWSTGMLSAFLDNTPTYVTFFSLAQGLHGADEIVGMPEAILIAISLGAVFMGALTYIGNAPNFMIKVIAEHRKIKMPSFFAYLGIASLVLLPIFGLITYLFLL